MKNSSNEKTESEWEKEKLDPNAWNQPRPSQQFNVIRRVYQQDALNKDADYQYPEKPLGYRCKKAVIGCGFGECLSNSIPILRWLPKYDFKANLMGDLIAGATTAVMHIPQGMAYALLAEVPPIVGLYMAFFPVLVYVVFGTSPHVSMGTFAVACLMAGKVVTQYSTHIDPGSAMNATAGLPTSTAEMGVPIYSPQEVLSIVCLAVGIFQVLMWIMRLGAVSTLLSETLVSGFTTAASFHVLASQLKDLFGLKLPKLPSNYKVVYTVIEICKNITNVNVAAFVISFITCLVIALNNELLKPWLSKRCRVPMPIELIAIVVGTLVSRFADLKQVFGIGLIGSIPTGLPVPQVPPVELFPTIAIDAFTITMVTYTISMSMSLIFAAKEKYEVDANQELLALGASNVFGSFFSCAPMCASLSRSYIQYQAGSKTGITSVVSSLLILCVLLWVGPFFELLPRCVLASIIVVSLKGMFMQVKELAKFWKLSKLDAVVWLVTFLITVLVNIDIGLGAGLLASVGALFCRSQKPYTCLLGRVLDTDLYLDTKRYRAAEELPGVKIFHYCGGLNFASKNLFRETLFRKIGYLKPTEVVPDDDNNLTKSDSYEWDPTIGHRVQCVIIDATALSYVDAPGVKTLVAVQRELVSSNITVLLAGANGPVLEMISKFNSLEADRLQLDTFPTVHDAVVYYKLVEAKKHEIAVTVTA
ncbi:prestin isoform X3 [Ostrinia furnacalis]|uniref:prestin isoform X3 n=1 Tax=Ostrinia furnacalis TaxID=93504 RepID=UPI00103F06AE|nr:prestin isoform X3 [Ostrinia furnacalis]XP_028162891.1 prestin isoform X3 [Ostrinia furnacalis]XP_028162893.1 prestin isoform X3 [Ostrinia furnacalis]XP_028162894.1 prestin isoform X3 [Ostrinia furnacalis]XP_028162895.1 prestin isoform X3 [Ostrinia furnacalis]XP_028162896.1 prestin isoform X3 [Ostrinia furnacalis]